MSNGYGRKAWAVVAFTYDADIHCLGCGQKRFGSDVWEADDSERAAVDSEGNPVHVLFSSDYEGGDVCGSCGAEIV